MKFFQRISAIFRGVFNTYIINFAEKSAKLRWGERGARSVRFVEEPEKTGARSPRARTRGKNPLVSKNGWFFMSSPTNDQ
jgi:hypothetical protein